MTTRIAAIYTLVVLAAPLAQAQVILRDLSVSDITISVSGAAAAADWTASFIAVWRFEESSGPSLDEAATSCTDCSLTWTGSPGPVQNATTYIEGSSSIDIADDPDTDALYCDSRTGVGNKCNAISLTGDVTYGMWVRIDQIDSGESMIMMHANPDSGWYKLTWDNDANKTIRCWIYDTAWRLGTGTTAQVATVWYHLVCKFDDDGDAGGDDDDRIRVYRNGAEVTSGTPTATNLAATTDQEYLFAYDTNLGGQTFDGQLDELFITDKPLTAQQICRICSCEIDGSLCTCNGASYVSSGRNASNCGSCSLPACNAAAP